MKLISLISVPSQELSLTLEDVHVVLRIKTLDDCTVFDLTRDNEIVLLGQRIISGQPLIPFNHLEEGNFILITEEEEMPNYTKFGTTQNLIYITADEVELINNGKWNTGV